MLHSKLIFMKKTIIALLLVNAMSPCYSQGFKKLPSLGVHFFFNDFQTAAELRANGLNNVLREKNFTKIKRMSPGIAFSYLEGLGSHLDFAGTISASFSDYPVPNVALSNRESLVLEAVATANLKLLTDKYCINPFLTAGVGASKYKGFYGAFVPIGAGLQFKLFKDVFALVNTQYRVPITENTAYHFYHSVGVAANIKERPAPPPVVIPPPIVTDRDGDGVLDENDKCPDIPGVAILNGCPDRDSDGIADLDDKCPDVPGLAKYGGCPIPDTDGDGINDEIDKCPTVKGVARYEGCPVPDADGDGINDEEDKCPMRPGPASNMGCPEISKEVIEKISFAARNVFYATGSYKLLAKSHASLNEVANLMKADPSLMLDIEGHTDSQGSEESNQLLSENRAKSVKEYLVNQGVAENRLKATGYGESKPIADNSTAAGRAKNRRTEITVRNY